MNIDLDSLADLHVFSSPHNETGVLEFTVDVYMHICTRTYGWMNEFVPPQRLKRFDGFYSYSVFQSLSTINRCLENMNLPAQELSTFQMGRKTQNGDFREIGSNDFD
jgi:hypothetical protein